MATHDTNCDIRLKGSWLKQFDMLFLISYLGSLITKDSKQSKVIQSILARGQHCFCGAAQNRFGTVTASCLQQRYKIQYYHSLGIFPRSWGFFNLTLTFLEDLVFFLLKSVFQCFQQQLGQSHYILINLLSKSCNF